MAAMLLDERPVARPRVAAKSNTEIEGRSSSVVARIQPI
jgi:hypothetical protein